jgi:hypothetical protein
MLRPRLSIAKSLKPPDGSREIGSNEVEDIYENDTSRLAMPDVRTALFTTNGVNEVHGTIILITT